MARAKISLNHAGIASILTSAEMHRITEAAAEAVAQNVREQGIKVGDRDGGAHEYDLPVKVDMTTTDRAHGSVWIPHPSAIAVQAKHGVLTKAASAAGLQVKGS